MYSTSVEKHWKHLNRFVHTIKENDLSLSSTKINLFQTKIRFLSHHIYQGTIDENIDNNEYIIISILRVYRWIF